jgi:hypothetical protein
MLPNAVENVLSDRLLVAMGLVRCAIAFGLLPPAH